MNISSSEQEVLKVRGLCKTYHTSRESRRQPLKVLEKIDLELYPRRTLALIGESGSGKSTLARCLVGFEQADQGEIWVEGEKISPASKKLRDLRAGVQLLWQESSAALSPYLTAQQIVDEPLKVCGLLSTLERRARIEELLYMVGLPNDCQERLAQQLSGGQLQRLAIARALAARPRILILDEPFHGLDLSIRNQILNLLLDLQARNGLTYLYISHDLELVRFFADEVAVLREGRVAARGRAAEFDPQVAYSGFPISPYPAAQASEGRADWGNQ